MAPPNILLQGIVGSQAYGLADENSDTDRLGLFAYPTEKILGLGSPAQSVVSTDPDITYHEAAKFVSLALKCNPTVLELLWLSEYEIRTAQGDALVRLRPAFLSWGFVRNAYLGYATQQFRRLENRSEQGDHSFSADTKKRTAKHARHLARLVRQGMALWHDGELHVRLDDPDWYRGFGNAVADGDLQIAKDQIAIAEQFMDETHTILPDQPDRDAVQNWLLGVRYRFLPDCFLLP